MAKRMRIAGVAVAMILGAAGAWAKLPPPPPPDAKAIAAADEKKAKDAAAAAKAKADLAAAEDRAIKNYQANMKKAGKPIPKPVPVAAASTPPKGGEPKPQSNTEKTNKKS